MYEFIDSNHLVFKESLGDAKNIESENPIANYIANLDIYENRKVFVNQKEINNRLVKCYLISTDNAANDSTNFYEIKGGKEVLLESISNKQGGLFAAVNSKYAEVLFANE